MTVLVIRRRTPAGYSCFDRLELLHKPLSFLWVSDKVKNVADIPPSRISLQNNSVLLQ